MRSFYRWFYWSTGPSGVPGYAFLYTPGPQYITESIKPIVIFKMTYNTTSASLNNSTITLPTGSYLIDYTVEVTALLQSSNGVYSPASIYHSTRYPGMDTVTVNGTNYYYYRPGLQNILFQLQQDGEGIPGSVSVLEEPVAYPEILTSDSIGTVVKYVTGTLKGSAIVVADGNIDIQLVCYSPFLTGKAGNVIKLGSSTVTSFIGDSSNSAVSERGVAMCMYILNLAR